MTKKNNKNSLKHGVYAKEILLPNESAEEFEQLRQAFCLQYNPIGEAEEAIVRGLVVIQWQISRLDGRLRRAFELDDRVASEIGQLPLNIIVQLAKTTNEKANVLVLDQRAKAFNFARQLAEINPALDNVGRILKLREQLERSFDKGVKSLVTAKEFKRLYGPKLIEQLPQAEPTSLAPDETDDARAKELENVQKLNDGEAT
jgi:hypothetical protein